MPSLFQVVCVGVVTIDALALVDRYPAADERVVGDQIAIVGGGPAANAAVVLARQGISVAFVGRVGADPEGEQAVRLLEMEGVDVSAVLRDPGAPTQTSCVVVAKESKTRAISTLTVPPLPSLADMGSRAVELVTAAEWVHVDHLGFGPVAELFGTMSPPSRPRLAVDAGNPIAGLDISLLDLYVPTAASLAAQYGQLETAEGVEKAAGLALAEGARAVVATSGSDGSTAWWSAEFAKGTNPGPVHVPASGGIEIMSTLGAGDVFHGALLSAICRGLDWPEALRQANDTAALSCRALDGRSAVPTLDELFQLYVGQPERGVLTHNSNS
ncbi:ribokinase [Cryobacterium sp. Hz7]|uniref:carbohydrate kinase family protein n=1 Tax=Cryobacterium sp. Hz7 TaxID=1259166 RepID=UPI00106A20BA|nr:PfkB family carbohydrate kinase [Cryobacterium sp. Hz7]TFB63481.1 ribokinase [Cryobacterium sp. Hz7]